MNVKKDQLICREGEPSGDLYKVISGKLMICSRNNSMVTALAYLERNEYFGEFSFFDEMKRSADVVAVEDSTLIKMPEDKLKKQFPRWLMIIAKSMTRKMRTMDEAIKKKGIKKRKSSPDALSIDEQRYYYEIIMKG